MMGKHLYAISQRKGLILFFIGILFFSFALLRFRQWSNFEIMFLAGIGLIFIILGLDLQIKSKISILGVTGIISSVLGVSLYYFYFDYINEMVAILYAIGISLLLTDIFTNNRDYTSNIMNPENSNYSTNNQIGIEMLPVQYKQRMEQKWQELVNITARPMEEYREEIRKKDSKMGALFQTLIKQKDTLEKLAFDNNDSKITTTLKELELQFEEFGIEEIEANPGRVYDPLQHVYEPSSNPKPENSYSGRITKLIKKGYFVKTGEKMEVLRPAIVIVDWDRIKELGDEKTKLSNR